MPYSSWCGQEPTRGAGEPDTKGNRRMSASRWRKLTHWMSLTVVSGLLLVSQAAAAEPVLEVVIGENTRQFGRDALLARPDALDIEVADSAYGKAMHYRAVPVAALLAGRELPADSV